AAARTLSCIAAGFRIQIKIFSHGFLPNLLIKNILSSRDQEREDSSYEPFDPLKINPQTVN
ncbi:hypothetical protein BOW13_10740, partial [Solemya velum gill symbiont]|uniref:hypothetical protein n=1 Tax=Solemya velum gill symbiont TaxID=2340 RepID=UPI0009CCACAF